MAQVMAAERTLATATAARARALSALAEARPATDDRPSGTPGAMSADRRAARPGVLAPVSEWVVRELRVSLAVTDVAAERMLVQALTLTRRLPGVLAALDGGTVHCGHLPALIELLDPVADDTLRARIEAELLRWLAARGAAGTITTPAQLRAKIHRVLLSRDARTQAEELRRALATRGVFTSPDPVPGMSGLHLRMTTAEAAALHAALDQLGAHLPDDPTDDGPARSKAERMLDVLLDSVLRPGTGSLPPVQVSLTVVAALETFLGGDTPGEIDGHVVPAAQIRTLLDLLTGSHLDAPLGDAEQDDERAGDERVGDTVRAADLGTAHAVDGEPSSSRPTTQVTSTTWSHDGEPPALDDATYWAMVDELIARAPDPDDMWWDPDDLTWPDADVDAVPSTHDDDSSTGETLADGTPSAAADTPGEAARHLGQQAIDAVARAQTALGELHKALRAADTAVADAQLAARSDEEGWQTRAGGGSDAADALEVLRAAVPARTAALHDLLAATATSSSGGLTHRPRIALTAALTGALVSLTDLPALRRAAATGAHLGAPADTDGYRPATTLDRHVRTRDRRCRAPGCRRPVMTGEVDHHVPHPAGATSASNLCGLCLTDHRGKHQAVGWQHELHPDGSYVVTTPAGLTARTAPPSVL
ncbi:HNH endonuclease signature motif containing protein [Klenkia sp. LSe6-5]|uniref:HNH endonuclease signature motif containing protein n=1 Tax=Klenkia sesuvii TaxID=3103137 RepID=A0ABU8DNN9_9ACTN